MAIDQITNVDWIRELGRITKTAKRTQKPVHFSVSCALKANT